VEKNSRLANNPSLFPLKADAVESAQAPRQTSKKRQIISRRALTEVPGENFFLFIPVIEIFIFGRWDAARSPGATSILGLQ
jgi:hypothetical protein